MTGLGGESPVAQNSTLPGCACNRLISKVLCSTSAGPKSRLQVSWMKVLVADEISKSGVEMLKAQGYTVDVRTGMKEDELVKIIKD